MRFSIAFDDNGTIRDASAGGDEVVPDAELPQTVERSLADMDTSKLSQLPVQREAADEQS
jgi:hypothetical protein